MEMRGWTGLYRCDERILAGKLGYGNQNRFSKEPWRRTGKTRDKLGLESKKVK